MTPYETATMVGAAFKKAEQKAIQAGGPNGPKVVRALRAACVVWADDDRLSGFDPVGSAMLVADSYGVGVVFLDSIGEAAVDSAVNSAVNAEVNAKVPAAIQANQSAVNQAIARQKAAVDYAEAAITPEEQSYVEMTMAKMKAAPERAREILRVAYENSPTTRARRMLEESAAQFFAALQAAEETTKNTLKDIYKMAEDKLQKGSDAAKWLVAGFVAINLIGVYLVIKYSAPAVRAGAKVAPYLV